VVPRLRGGHDVVHDGCHAALCDLLHEMPAETLLPGPLEVPGIGPVAAQTDLDDVVSTQRTVLDQAPHGRPVRQDYAPQVRRVVRVGVEVDQAEVRRLQARRHGADVRMGDGMIATEDDRDGSRGADLADGHADGGVATGLVGWHDLGIAVVHHRQHLERVHAEVDARPEGTAAHVRQADGARAEPSPGPVRHRLVDGRAENGHVDSLEIPGIEDERELRERRSGPGVGRLATAADRHARHQAPPLRCRCV
jgi:hypothetical protein